MEVLLVDRIAWVETLMQCYFTHIKNIKKGEECAQRASGKVRVKGDEDGEDGEGCRDKKEMVRTWLSP